MPKEKQKADRQKQSVRWEKMKQTFVEIGLATCLQCEHVSSSTPSEIAERGEEKQYFWADSSSILRGSKKILMSTWEKCGTMAACETNSIRKKNSTSALATEKQVFLWIYLIGSIIINENSNKFLPVSQQPRNRSSPNFFLHFVGPYFNFHFNFM